MNKTSALSGDTAPTNDAAFCKRYVADEMGNIRSEAKQAHVCVEAPLQINVIWQNPESGELDERVLMTTMRTPGQEQFLVTGLLQASQVINSINDITTNSLLEANLIEVQLNNGIVPNWREIERLGLSLSSCGICGQKQIQQLALRHQQVSDETANWLSAAQIMSMPNAMSDKQQLFSASGGLHAAAIWHSDEILWLCEDIGRHNAVDKVIGRYLCSSQAEDSDNMQRVLILSGRISFELVQKAIMADIPVIVALGAPSTLAISLAKQFGITLVGFTREQQFNLYCGEQRIV